MVASLHPVCLGLPALGDLGAMKREVDRLLEQE
jgi:hypothetical protein